MREVDTPVDEVVGAHHVRSQLREALHRRDLEGFAATLTPDVVIQSPFIADPFGFEGSGEAVQAMRAFFDEVHDLVFTAEGGGSAQFLSFDATIRGRDIQGVFLMQPNAEGRIKRIIVYVRPFVGLSAFGRAIGPGFVRPHRPLVAATMVAVLVPVTCFAALINRIATRLVKTSATHLADSALRRDSPR